VIQLKMHICAYPGTIARIHLSRTSALEREIFGRKNPTSLQLTIYTWLSLAANLGPRFAELRSGPPGLDTAQARDARERVVRLG
jgi:hypothetical protein